MSLGDTVELAQGYTQLNKFQRDASSFLLDRLGISAGLHVLDVGCGPGDITSRIAQVVGPDGSVVGVDVSKERIAIAQKLSGPNLSFYEAKAEDLSHFSDASFDIVFVNATLHWVQNQPLAIREFSRVLKSGGRLGISGESGDFVADHARIKSLVLAREPFCGYPEEGGPKFLKRSELTALLDNAGFGERNFVINKIVKSAKDGNGMVDWLATSSSGKTYGGIPMDLRPKAREQMSAEWEKLATEDGIYMDLNLLVTVATKA